MAKREIDWTAIEKDYRAGIKSNKQMEREYGCTEAAIRKKAKKEGWVRDLKTSIRELAAKKVRELEVREKFEGSSKDEVELEDTQIVEENANIQADVIRSHRKDVSRARNVAQLIIQQLEVAVLNPDQLEHFAEMRATFISSGGGEIDADGNVDSKEEAKVNEKLLAYYTKIMDVGNQAGAIDRLANALSKLVTLERTVFNIDSERDGNQTLESFLSGLD